MKHPFAATKATELNNQQTQLVVGGSLTSMPAIQVFVGPKDGKAIDAGSFGIRPIEPPIFYTQAIGEDGGDFPDPSLV